MRFSCQERANLKTQIFLIGYYWCPLSKNDGPDLFRPGLKPICGKMVAAKNELTPGSYGNGSYEFSIVWSGHHPVLRLCPSHCPVIPIFACRSAPAHLFLLHHVSPCFLAHPQFFYPPNEPLWETGRAPRRASSAPHFLWAGTNSIRKVGKPPVPAARVTSQMQRTP
jgi:hypothetical protein